MKKQSYIYIVIFLVAWVFFSFINRQVEYSHEAVSDISIDTKEEWVVGQLATFSIKNNTDEAFILSESQNPPENLHFQKWSDGDWQEIVLDDYEKTDEALVIAAGEEIVLSYTNWNNELFGELGRYRVLIQYEDQVFTDDFDVVKAGLLRSIYTVIFFEPIFNILVFFINFFPYHSLALSIVILTFLIKLLLLKQSRNSLVHQKKMKLVNEEVAKLKKKHGNDQKKISYETMQLWKKHNFNPFSSFLSVFIQLPVMIALYRVVRYGLLPHNHIFLYAPLQSFDLTLVNTHFFGILELSDTGVLWFAILVGILQFISVSLSASGKKKKKKGQMQAISYFMPMMIAFFAYSLPVAVGFYWVTSTSFSIVQQLVLGDKLSKKTEDS